MWFMYLSMQSVRRKAEKFEKKTNTLIDPEKQIRKGRGTESV